MSQLQPSPQLNPCGPGSRGMTHLQHTTSCQLFDVITLDLLPP